MKAIKLIAYSVLALGLSLSAAAALNEDEQHQLDQLVGGASDITQGARVGKATIIASGGALLQGEAACTFSRLLNADTECTTTAVVFPQTGKGIDTIYYEPPEAIGYVNMDDWTEDVNSQIDDIWQGYVEGSKAQSERIGFDVVPLKWVQYPTLNKSANVMTYGILLNFGGEKVINLTAVKFTRSGYVTMQIVTDDAMLAHDNETYDSVTVYAAQTYQPRSGARYADFQDGDRVAAIGAVGVLASVMGVKYSKGWLAGIGGAILLLAKKFWFLLVAVPAAFWAAIKRLFGRGEAPH